MLQKLFTDAVNATWPLAGIVFSAGEIVTVTSFTLYPLPPPQLPTKNIRKASNPTNRALRVPQVKVWPLRMPNCRSLFKDCQL